MAFTEIWKRWSRSTRQPTSIEAFRRASRCRDEGRFEEAAQLVARGLDLDPKSIVGHLLAAHLHLVFREVEAAKGDFELVLSFDRHQPRALLGLARIALEEGAIIRCRELLLRALDRYADFPEAQALFDAIEALPANPDLPGIRAIRAKVVHPEGLHAPADSVETLLLREDGSLLFAHPRGSIAERGAAHMARIARLASAVLGHATFGALGGALIEGSGDATHVRTDGAVLLAVSFGRNVEEHPATVAVDRLWRASKDAIAPEPR